MPAKIVRLQGPTPEVWLTPEAAPIPAETPTPREALLMLGPTQGAAMTGEAIPGAALIVPEAIPEEAPTLAETTIECSRTPWTDT